MYFTYNINRFIGVEGDLGGSLGIDQLQGTPRRTFLGRAQGMHTASTVRLSSMSSCSHTPDLTTTHNKPRLGGGLEDD